MTSEKFVKTRAKAFDGETIRSYRFAVESNGTVRVWDEVAGHYTTCHSLAKSAIRRIQKLARTKLETSK